MVAAVWKVAADGDDGMWDWWRLTKVARERSLPRRPPDTEGAGDSRAQPGRPATRRTDAAAAAATATATAAAATVGLHAASCLRNNDKTERTNRNVGAVSVQKSMVCMQHEAQLRQNKLSNETRVNTKQIAETKKSHGACDSHLWQHCDIQLMKQLTRYLKNRK